MKNGTKLKTIQKKEECVDQESNEDILSVYGLGYCFVSVRSGSIPTSAATPVAAEPI
jgi:hypothetical protein